MKAITVTWNGKTDETLAKATEDFNVLDDVTKIDVIQDSINYLEALKEEVRIRLYKKHLKGNAND